MFYADVRAYFGRATRSMVHRMFINFYKDHPGSEALAHEFVIRCFEAINVTMAVTKSPSLAQTVTISTENGDSTPSTTVATIGVKRSSSPCELGQCKACLSGTPCM